MASGGKDPGSGFGPGIGLGSGIGSGVLEHSGFASWIETWIDRSGKHYSKCTSCSSCLEGLIGWNSDQGKRQGPAAAWH